MISNACFIIELYRFKFIVFFFRKKVSLLCINMMRSYIHELSVLLMPTFVIPTGPGIIYLWRRRGTARIDLLDDVTDYPAVDAGGCGLLFIFRFGRGGGVNAQKWALPRVYTSRAASLKEEMV